ncbi:MAG: D-alanine--D-alanine ligase family protein, partial [Acidimicrobiales bacterium]
MRLVILFGGRSAEHDVSCVSATHVAAAADPGRYEVVPVGITIDGRWVEAVPGVGGLRDAGDEVDPSEVLADADVVFPLLHGPLGEDGTVQGLLELAGVPYVGAGVLGSALCMDKAMAKQVVGCAGLPQVRHVALRDTEVDDDALARAAEDLKFPLFVKPANLGSSVGVSRAVDAGELAAAVELALTYDEWLVIEEEAVAAREIECGLLGFPHLRASAPGEVRPSHPFYDYDDKYTDGAAEVLAPAPLPCPVTQEVRRLAVEAGRALRVDGMARVDFLYEEGGRGLLVNEVNTIPG